MSSQKKFHIFSMNFSRYDDKNPSRLRRSAMSVHWTDAFRHATELVGSLQRYKVFVSMPNFSLQKGDGCLDSVVEKAIMKMQKKTQRLARGLAVQFIDFLHAMEYQLHAGIISATLFLP